MRLTGVVAMPKLPPPPGKKPKTSKKSSKKSSKKAKKASKPAKLPPPPVRPKKALPPPPAKAKPASAPGQEYGKAKGFLGRGSALVFNGSSSDDGDDEGAVC